MSDAFRIGRVLRAFSEEGAQLYVGEMQPDNAERPWLVIRGGAEGPFVVAGAKVALPLDRS